MGVLIVVPQIRHRADRVVHASLVAGRWTSGVDASHHRDQARYSASKHR
jgi:hypothetical protein